MSFDNKARPESTIKLRDAALPFLPIVGTQATAIEIHMICLRSYGANKECPTKHSGGGRCRNQVSRERSHLLREGEFALRKRFTENARRTSLFAMESGR